MRVAMYVACLLTSIVVKMCCAIDCSCLFLCIFSWSCLLLCCGLSYLSVSVNARVRVSNSFFAWRTLCPFQLQWMVSDIVLVASLQGIHRCLKTGRRCNLGKHSCAHLSLDRFFNGSCAASSIFKSRSEKEPAQTNYSFYTLYVFSSYIRVFMLVVVHFFF